MRAVAISPTSPLILAGKARISVLPPGRFAYPASEAALPELAALDKAVAPLYAAKGVPQPLSRLFGRGAAWRLDRLAAYEREMVRSRNGDPPVSRFPDLAARLVAEFRRTSEAALGFLAFAGSTPTWPRARPRGGWPRPWAMPRGACGPGRGPGPALGGDGGP